MNEKERLADLAMEKADSMRVEQDRSRICEEIKDIKRTIAVIMLATCTDFPENIGDFRRIIHSLNNIHDRIQLKEPVCITVQSHNWGGDVTLEDYVLPFTPAVIEAVYENMVTGYCDERDHSAVGQTVTSAKELMKAIGRPGGYQHCRLQIVLKEPK